MDKIKTQKEFIRLVEIMQRLRAKNGCPWDRKQTHKSLLPYIIEEAYEVIEEINKNDKEHMKEELGDLLLQVVFQAHGQRIFRARLDFSKSRLALGIIGLGMINRPSRVICGKGELRGFGENVNHGGRDLVFRHGVGKSHAFVVSAESNVQLSGERRNFIQLQLNGKLIVIIADGGAFAGHRFPSGVAGAGLLADELEIMRVGLIAQMQADPGIHQHRLATVTYGIDRTPFLFADVFQGKVKLHLAIR